MCGPDYYVEPASNEGRFAPWPPYLLHGSQKTLILDGRVGEEIPPNSAFQKCAEVEARGYVIHCPVTVASGS